MAVESSEIQRGEYLPRVADGLLTQALQSSGAVQIKGPKWCGKTATAERQSASQVFMQDPDRSATLLALADTKPSLILRGEEPRLIDEWQMAPQLWDAVRFDIENTAFALCRGGWPEAVVESRVNVALRMAADYVEELLDSDINRMDGIKRNKTWMRLIMRSYARNISSQASQSTIAADMQGEPPSEGTLSDYLDALSRACVTEDLPAWNPRLRSKTAVRTSPTRHFSDPSIACAVLHATPEKLLNDFETFGLLFESMCIRDLRVYADALGGDVFHYRDKTGLESDAVIGLHDGRWALIEVKLGEKQVDIAAAHLKKLADRIDQDHEGRPSFLMVLTATAAAYRRDDGVLVVPLATLAP